MGAFKSNRKLGIIVNASNFKIRSISSISYKNSKQNEASAFEDFWKPGGQTFPGNMPEAIIDEVPWGEFTIRKLGGD